MSVAVTLNRRCATANIGSQAPIGSVVTIDTNICSYVLDKICTLCSLLDIRARISQLIACIPSAPIIECSVGCGANEMEME